MKLTGNFYIAAAIELIAEGMNMGERAGLSRDTLLEFYSYMLPGGHDTRNSRNHGKLDNVLFIALLQSPRRMPLLCT